jgi:membrane fusion protein, copper/silver efflux system
MGASSVEAQTTPPPGKGNTAQNLANAYLVLQTKLAADDFAGARAACGGVRSAVQAATLTPELKKRVETGAVDCAAAADIAKLRAAFSNLSEALLAYFGVQPNPLPVALTVARCPMAFEGKGGKWLQTGESLRNPYYGAEMLTCGDTETKLKPGQKL